MIDHRHLVGSEDLEVALTRNLVLELKRRDSPSVRVGYPVGTEDTHGADLELWVRSRGLRVGFRLQAKTLKPRQRLLGAYDELDHRIGGKSSNRRQVDVLIENTVVPLNPGFLFYNGLEHEPPFASACCRDDEWSARNGQLGLTFAMARRIQSLLDGSVAYPKRLSSVLPRSYPLPCVATCVDVSSIAPRHMEPWLGGPIFDFLSRMPGWVLDGEVGLEPLWVVVDEDSFEASAKLEALTQLGWSVRVSDPAATAYVETLLEAGEFIGIEAFFDVRPEWPVVVIDLEPEGVN